MITWFDFFAHYQKLPVIQASIKLLKWFSRVSCSQEANIVAHLARLQHIYIMNNVSKFTDNFINLLTPGGF